MNENSNLLSNQEHVTLVDSSIFIDDSIDEYLDDPTLSVSDMIEQVKRIHNGFFFYCLFFLF